MINFLSSAQWIFDGIGTEIICMIISLIVGGIGGGIIGYRIGIKNKTKQNQKAKDNANQVQIGNVNNITTQEKDDGHKTNAESGR